MPRGLPEALLDLKKWDQLSREECVEIAFQVERLLPPSFRFTNLETFTSPADQHNIAYFEWTAPPGTLLTYHDLQLDPAYPWHGLTDEPESQEEWSGFSQRMRETVQDHVNFLRKKGYIPHPNKQHITKFALIPGNTITLGYDPDHPQLPSDELIFDAEKWNLISTIDGSMRNFDDQDVSLEAKAEDDYWRQKPRNYAAIAEYMAESLLPSRTVTIQPFLMEQSYVHLGEFLNLVGVYQDDHFYKNSLQNQPREYGSLFLPTGTDFSISHKLATELLKKQGFRLPSSDEWEYACMAGRKSILFWEDSDKPFDYYPNFPQNTFGLHIARYSYDYEFCLEPDILRGGDGGYSQCGWGGYLFHYFCYVSAYAEIHDPAYISRYCFRRAYSL